MNHNIYMTISEFAQHTGIKRDNLIFYDKMGLITPELRGENGYRYYTQRQLPTAFLVVSLRELGISIQTIKDYTQQRTPQKMIELFERQKEKIEIEMKTLHQLKGIMELYTDITTKALQEDSASIQIKQRQQEPVFFGPSLDESQSFSEERMNDFYEYAAAHAMALTYPLGIVYSKESLRAGSIPFPEQFYFKVPQSNHQFKPAGTYVVGYLQGSYGQVGELYVRMLDFIEHNHLVICGSAYEEYPLSEFSVQKEDEYLIQVEIMIES